MDSGRLLVCATPIGNLGDVSERLRSVLAEADIIFAEDTRRTAKLLSHLAIRVPVVSLFTGNERARTQQLVEEVTSGKTVVLVTDAGMPAVSDPGASAVRSVREAGYPVTVVPGPSAVTMAVALSGFEAERFVFEGFLPRRGAERERRVEEIAGETRVVVLFASPNRLPRDLHDLSRASGGERVVAVMRELTKLHEETWVGPLTEAVARWAEPVKGEVTLVLGPMEPTPPSIEAAVATARGLVERGSTLRDAAKQSSEASGVSRRAIYQALLEAQDSS